jgi:FixJ family two-component response regulator
LIRRQLADMKSSAANDAKETLISIVDDEACVRESLSSLMRSEGYRTKEYTSAEEFLEREKLDDSACLIVDVRLHGIDGLELQQRLAKTKCDRPIIFISGHATAKEQTLAIVRGAVAFLCKPFRDEAILTAVRESIARGRMVSAFRPETARKQVCPLCHESTQVGELPKQLVCGDDLRETTISVIKALYPAWVEQDGVCQRCWSFYVGLGRVGNFPNEPVSFSQAASSGSKSTAGAPPKE